MLSSALIVETVAGKVQGTAVSGVQFFAGIPYAGHVSGPHRFLPPRAPEPWSGVLRTVGYGPSAPQPPRPPSPCDSASLPQAEDCLFLNIWTSGADASKPVLVWIHGGGFSTGSGSSAWVDGSQLASAHEAVVVTLNHRLGLLGFLDLSAERPGYALSAHSSMLDLVAALTWVRDNIAAFGGDPGRVTIFGESGGGGKVLSLAAMPSARGLFHRAVVQSGIFLNGPGELLQSSERAAEITERVLMAAGGVRALLDAPVERLIEIQRRIEQDHRPGSGGLMPFAPVADGAVIPDHPRALALRGELADVPFIIGSNSDEATLFQWASNPEFRKHGRSWEPGEDWLRAALQGYTGGNAQEILRVYRAHRRNATNAELYFAIASDNMRIGAIRMAEALIRGHRPSVWMYFFSWQSTVQAGILGASHSFEIPFVFGNAARVFGGNADSVTTRLDREMSAAWTSFAGLARPEVPGVVAWPEYTIGYRHTMAFGALTALECDPRRVEREAWRAL
jgi:para-nitrobenzyl esterase